MIARRKIRVKIVDNNCITRFPCDVCGGQQGKNSRLAVFTLEDGLERLICENCLITGANRIEDRLIERARRLDAETAEARRWATDYDFVFPPDEVLEEAFVGFSTFREYGCAPV